VPFACPSPVFIIGAPRSGTTALAWSLARHPDFWTSGETQLFVDLFGDGRLERNYARGGTASHSWLEKMGVDRQRFLASVGLGLNVLLTDLAGGRRWIDKTPANTLLAEMLAEMYPGARFLHLVRDGRRVVHSMINFATHESRSAFAAIGEPWMSDFRSACATWREYVTAARRFSAAHPSRCLTVEAESLLLEPDLALARILEFLGAEPHDGPALNLATRRLNSSFAANTPNGEADPDAVRELRDAVDPWQVWGREQRSIFLEEAGDLLTECDFALEDELRIEEWVT
jgi:hypothetical protein